MKIEQKYLAILLWMILIWCIPYASYANDWGNKTLNVGDECGLQLEDATLSLLSKSSITIVSYKWESEDWACVEVLNFELWGCNIKALRPCEDIKVKFTCKYKAGGRDYTESMSHYYEISVRGLSISPSETSLAVGGQIKLNTAFIPLRSASPVTWSSSAPSIASVSDDGTVTGVSAGTATITATTYWNTKATCNVTVTGIAPSRISLPSSQTLSINEQITLTPTITPSNAQTVLTWSSDNKSIATVSSSGVVKGVGVGTTKIRVQTSNGLSDWCSVTVEEEPILPTNISLLKSQSLKVGEEVCLEPVITPSNAQTALTWSSDNKSIATVSSSGVVKGVGPGTTKIRVNTSNSLSDWCNVTVEEIPIIPTLTLPECLTVAPGKSITLTPTLTPPDESVTYTWTSDNPTVAIVDSKGVVLGRKIGTATITATSSTGITATCQVIVDDVVPTEIALPETDEFFIGEKKKLTPIITPSNAKTTLTWESTSPNVATVSEDGVVEGIREGSTLIIVTTDNGLSAWCEITVKKDPYKDGDTFIAYTDEGIEMTFKVISTEERTCQVGVGADENGFVRDDDVRAISKTISGQLSIPSEALGYQVITIGDGAFCGCSGLAYITIPNSVTSIGNFAFMDCNGLTSMVIPDGVTSIGRRSFYGCSSLTSVTIGSGVTSIGEDTFYDCGNLTAVYISDLAAWCKIEFEGLWFCNPLYYSHHLYLNGEEIKDLIIPEGVTSISKSFLNCSSITSVIIPNSVTDIGLSSFYGCSGLTSITIPETVTYIGSGNFSFCSNLTSVTINSNSIVSGYHNKDYNIDRLFGSQVKEYILGNGVTGIGDYAFYDCSNLISIMIPNSVTDIGDYAFSGCSGLTSVTIPENVASIGSWAFCDCSGLTDVTFGENVTTIGCDAFSNTPWYDNHSDGLVYAGKIAYKYFGTMPENTSIIIKEGTQSIGDNAFYDCSGLTSVTIPNSVTSIGQSAFSDCSGLTSVSIPNSVTSIGDLSFYGCSGLTSVTIPNSVTNIGSWAFCDCSGLTAITIPESVISIGYNPFQGCYFKNDSFVNNSSLVSDNNWGATIYDDATSDGLLIKNNVIVACRSWVTSVTIPESVTSIGSSAFSGCSGLTSVTIPNSVTNIGSYAFWGCSSMTAVTIPESVTSIEKGTFSGCSGLTSIYIPNNVTSIGGSAFEYCSHLESIAIGNGVREIWYEPFEGCDNIKDVYCFAKQVPDYYWRWSELIFTDLSEDATLHVPASSIVDYKLSEAWNGFNNIVPLTEEEITPVKGIQDDKKESSSNVQSRYDLSGHRLSQPQRGLNIIRTSDGKTRKVVIK